MSVVDIGQEGPKEIFHERDCGMIILDKNGEPLAMHHASGEGLDIGTSLYYSYSVPLCNIIKEHAGYFPNFVPQEDDDSNNTKVTIPELSSRKARVLHPLFGTGMPYGFIGSSRGRKGGKKIDMTKFAKV